jgi:predicted RNase H-like HicB family nuclease
LIDKIREVIAMCLEELEAESTTVVEKDLDTSLYVGCVPGFPGAHSQGETLDELQANLREVIEMLLEDENLILPKTTELMNLEFGRFE